MPSREDVLQFTNLGTDSVQQRVYYTLTSDHKNNPLATEESVRRSCALLASLIDQLKGKGVLATTEGEDDIDNLLYQFGQDEMLKAGG